jgi:tRNA(Ile2) C34 agmatinyltransferase TiaS
MTESNILLDENGNEEISLCKWCNCMTKSIYQGVYKCGKCGGLK